MTIEQEIAGVIPASLDVEEAVTSYLPEHAKMSSAGLTSLLASDIAEVERSFGMMLTEFEAGSTSTMERLKETQRKSTQDMDRNILMEELARPDIPIERKKEIIDFFASPPDWKRDSATLVTEKYLAAPSGNETVEQEKRRLDLANRLAPVHQYRRDVISIRNALQKTVDEQTKFQAADSFMEFFMPFADTAQAYDTLSRVKESLGNPRQAVRNALLPGSAKETIRELISKVPKDQLSTQLKKITEQLKLDSGMVIREDNHLATLALFDELFGDYTWTDKAVDNAIGILDASIIFAPVVSSTLKPIERIKQFKKLDDLVRTVERRTVADAVSERSVASIVRDSNPDKAREFHAMVVKTEGETVANAAYGTSRAEAIASDVLPQVDSVDGSVVNKVPDIEKKTIELDADLVEHVRNGSSYRYTDAEYNSAIANIVNDFHNATGLHVNPSMGQIGATVDGDSVLVKAVYGNTEGGFSLPDLAFERAKQAFRKQGILDDEIKLLKNEGGRYEPVDFNAVKGVEGDYLVQVEMRVPLSKADPKFEPLSVKWNFLDRIPAFQFARSGNIQRWFFDAGSTFDKHISGAAVEAIDRAAAIDKRLLAFYHEFADGARKLKGDRQDKLMKHIKEANANQLELTDAQLIANGFNTEEVALMKKWRRANDMMYYVENSDLVKTLDHQRFMLFDNGSDRFLAKEVQQAGLKEQVYNRSTKTYDTLSIDVYDPVSQAVTRLTEQELDDLYTAGGTFAKLRRPQDFGGQIVEYIKVENKGNNSLRGLRDTDQVLNYRKGYFQVQYDAPLFVVQKVKDANGKTFEKRVAVATSQKEADEALAAYAQRDGVSKEEWGFVAEDKRGMRMDGDAYWDIQSASGRIAQRHRGKRLEGSTGTNFLGKDMEHMLDPIESSIRAARSLSSRVATRDVLETMKARALFQYQDFFPSNGMGGVRWPSNPTDIVSKSKTTTKDIADARSTWHYIDYLENGYINTIDESWKWAMNSMANVFGKHHFTAAEKAAYALQDLAPSQLGKEVVFHAYIGTNPLRQILVQPHQAIRMMAYNPKGFISGQDRAIGYVQGLLSPSSITNKEQIAFNKAVEASGIMAAVDKQNLVRGALVEMTESSNRIKRTVGKGLSAPRMVGFDLGERANMLIHFSNVWDKKKREGFDVFDKRVQSEIHSETRALSYDMNLAGDMPYNQNWAALLMQFAQVPHKAILQPLNRRISTSDKVKLAIFDTAMWGVPIYTISDWVGKDMTPENTELRQLVQNGIEQQVLNFGIQLVTGDDTEIDFKSSFSPYDWGWAEVAYTIMVDGSIAKALANSPSGKLLFSENSRLSEAFTTLGQFLHAKDSYGTDPTAWNVVNDFLRISSGWRGISDAYKAAYIREANDAMTKDGVVLDPNRSNLEVLMSVVGFQTKNVNDIYELSESLYRNKDKFRDEVMSAYKEAKMTLFKSKDAPATEIRDLARILGEMERVYQHNPEVHDLVMQQFRKDFRGKDKWVVDMALRSFELGEYRLPTLLKRIEDFKGATEEDKVRARTLVQDLEQAQKYYMENRGE